jgi:hypothetical protein
MGEAGKSSPHNAAKIGSSQGVVKLQYGEYEGENKTETPALYSYMVIKFRLSTEDKQN